MRKNLERNERLADNLWLTKLEGLKYNCVKDIWDTKNKGWHMRWTLSKTMESVSVEGPPKTNPYSNCKNL